MKETGTNCRLEQCFYYTTPPPDNAPDCQYCGYHTKLADPPPNATRNGDMTLDQATVIIEDILTNVHPGDPPEEHQALALAIQAFLAIQTARVNNYYTPISRLKGEKENAPHAY